MITPHENEINFDPAVRLPQTEAENAYYNTTPDEPTDFTDKGCHDRSVERATKSLRRRNIAGSLAMLVGGGTAVERLLELNFIPNTTATSMSYAAIFGFLSSMIGTHHREAKEHKASATRFAALEASDAERENRQPADWALYRLQEANTSADEILLRPNR